MRAKIWSLSLGLVYTAHEAGKNLRPKWNCTLLRVSDPVIVIGIRFLNYALNFMYVISNSNILFSHGSFIFDVI